VGAALATAGVDVGTLQVIASTAVESASVSYLKCPGITLEPEEEDELTG
jgi:hypothetical protein